MNNWTIKVLDYGYLPCDKGKITPGYDAGLILNTPFLGYLLQNEEETVLVDCGVNESYFAGKGGWGGTTPVGGSKSVLQALAKEGLTPSDINKVIYTHLHNDHAGNCHLFHGATAIFQKDELENLKNPLPSQLATRDYDLGVIDRLAGIKNTIIVNGDIELANGLKLYKTPGHTRGSQSILVQTQNGPRLILGDVISRFYMLFPGMDELVQADGSVAKITPLPHDVCPVFLHSLTYDHYAFFESYNKIKAIVPAYEPKYFLPGHEPSLLFTGVQ